MKNQDIKKSRGYTYGPMVECWRQRKVNKDILEFRSKKTFFKYGIHNTETKKETKP